MICSCGNPAVAKGMCRRCHKAKWYRDNLPAARQKSVAYQRQYAIDNPEKVRAAKRRCATGVSPELFSLLWSTQGGRCALCSRAMEPTGRSLYSVNADHCHRTGRARGLLCRACNTSLGTYEKHQRPAGLRIECYDVYLEASVV